MSIAVVLWLYCLVGPPSSTIFFTDRAMTNTNPAPRTLGKRHHLVAYEKLIFVTFSSFKNFFVISLRRENVNFNASQIWNVAPTVPSAFLPPFMSACQPGPSHSRWDGSCKFSLGSILKIESLQPNQNLLHFFFFFHVSCDISFVKVMNDPFNERSF